MGKKEYSHEEKVELFEECIINNTDEFTLNRDIHSAVLEASDKYGLNAAWFGDSDAFEEARDKLKGE